MWYKHKLEYYLAIKKKALLAMPGHELTSENYAKCKKLTLETIHVEGFHSYKIPNKDNFIKTVNEWIPEAGGRNGDRINGAEL